MKGSWWGAAVIAFGVALRLVGTYFHLTWVEQLSLLPCIGGAFVLLGGMTAWRWAWPAVLFLIFMIPLPYRVDVAMAGPLRHWATASSTFLLQTAGLPALAEGNIILLDDMKLDVVEACSGLRMLVIFFALSTAVALIVQRPLWERLLILFSAVPIAIVANIVRITGTGVLLNAASTSLARAVYHDIAGWLMMPVGLCLLALELWVLNHLWLEARPGAPGRRVLVAEVPAPQRRPWRGQEAVSRGIVSGE
jgi:exosortase